jgi:D-sedoheptulose 7-phosphate isomerase
MNFSDRFLTECRQVIDEISSSEIEKLADALHKLREMNGRLFFLGSGGGAGHASHATCDFRKLCNIESYSPYDNVSELTARVNDEGWDVTLSHWLKVSRLTEKDGIFVFSVGGGSILPPISANLVQAIQYAKSCKAKIFGIVGKNGGYTKQVGDAVVVVPVVSPQRITPLTEGFQAIVWHLLVSHPKLQLHSTKWESVKEGTACEKTL